MAIKSSGIEQEVIILKAAKELIDSMVNFELMSLEGNDPDSEIAFKSITHQRFFNIILVDFLSCTDKKGPIKQTSYLGGLREIVDNPCFDENNSVHNLKIAAKEFKDWIEQKVEVSVWLPSIDKETKMKKTSKPIIAGILSIIAGVLSLLGAIGVIIGIIFFVSVGTQPFLTDMWGDLGDLGIGLNFLIILLVIGAIFSAILGILPLLGGIYALQRKKWGLALAGSIVAIFGSTPLGIASTILVAIAKDEFE